MKKITSGNNFLRYFYIVVGIFPLLFYFFVGGSVNDITVDSIVFLGFCLFWIFVFVKFGCLDWDIFITNSEFIVKRGRKALKIDIEERFEIRSYPILSFFFNLYEISFQNGMSFSIKNKPITKVVDTFSESLRIKTEILSEIHSIKNSQLV